MAAGAVVLVGGTHVVLVRRGRPPLLGHFSLPGGRVEASETPKAAVVREVYEETGIDVEVVASIDTVVLEHAGTTFSIDEFLCVPTKGTIEPRAGDDAAEVAIVPRGELGNYSLTEAVLRVVEKGFALAHARGLP